MKYNLSGSVILVHLAGTDQLTAFLGYGPEDGESNPERIEVTIDAPTDISDYRDWMRQALASLVEAV